MSRSRSDELFRELSPGPRNRREKGKDLQFLLILFSNAR